MASKYYAVKKGKVPGIYLNWNDCKAMVEGYQGAVYKSFKTIEEAENLLTERKLLPERKLYRYEIIRRKWYICVCGRFIQ